MEEKNNFSRNHSKGNIYEYSLVITGIYYFIKTQIFVSFCFHDSLKDCFRLENTMENSERLELENYKYDLLLGFNDSRILYSYRNIVALGFSWTAFKHFCKICENKFPRTKFLLFPVTRSFVVWGRDEDVAASFGGKEKFAKQLEEYIIEWLQFNDRVKSLDSKTQRKFRRTIRRFRRYGKITQTSLF